MGSYRTSKLGETFYDVFTVFDFDLVSTVTGELPGDFIVTFSRNDQEVTGIAYSISEIGDTGTYAVTVPGGFASEGLWALTVFVDYNGSVWRSHIEVRAHDIDDVYDVVVAGGSGMEPVTLQVLDSSHGNVPLADVLVHVYDDTGAVFITFGRTDSSGELELLLDVDSYVVKLYKPGVSALPQTIVVPAGGGSFTLYAASILVAPPPSPLLCRIFADFVTQDGLPFQKFKIKIENLFDPNTPGGLAVIERSRSYETDASGHVEFDVVRGARIRVAFITTPLVRDIIVPSQPVANLLTVLGATTDAFQVVKK